MAKSIKDMVKDAILDMIENGKLVIQDDNGETVEDLTVGVSEDDDYDDDSEDVSEEDDSDDEDEGESDE